MLEPFNKIYVETLKQILIEKELRLNKMKEFSTCVTRRVLYSTQIKKKNILKKRIFNFSFNRRFAIYRSQPCVS